MSRRRSTPEEVILEFTPAEMMELLSDLGLEANFETAQQLKQLVRLHGNFEHAMEMISGPATMRRAA